MENEKLPANWIQRQSSKHNVPYYHNTLTKESVWIHPAKQGVRCTNTKVSTATGANNNRMPVVVVPKAVKKPNLNNSQNGKAEGSGSAKATNSRSSLHNIQANSRKFNLHYYIFDFYVLETICFRCH